MKQSLRAAAVLLCAFVVAGCQPGSSDETVLRFWAMGREGEVVTELLPEFERAHPGIRVEVQQLPWTAAHEKLLTAFAGDATPDLCQLGNTWIPEFVALGALAPLDAQIAGSPDIKPDDYFSGIWDTNVIASRVYGIPWYVDTRLFFYRKDILAKAGFKQPPRDWEEWRRQLLAIKSLVGSDRYGVLLPLNEFEPLVALSLQQDEPLLRDDGRWGNFRSASFRRTLAFYVDMFRQQLAPPMTSSQISNVWTELGRGYFTFYISGPWNIGEFKRRLPPEQQGTWATAPLPGPHGPGASIAGGASLAVFAASKHKAAAWQLIEFLSQPAVQARFRGLTGDLPPRRSSWQDAALAVDPYAAAFREQLERVKPTPKVPEWERIATEMRVVTEATVHGDLSIDQAAAELDARTDRILDKRRWMLARSVGK